MGGVAPARHPQPVGAGGGGRHPVSDDEDNAAEKRGDERIRLSVPEVRALLLKLVWAAVPLADRVLAWSAWRRRHPYRARACHYRTRGARPPD